MSCREQIPDPEFFALCIRESFQEYLELASRPKPRRKPAGNKKGKVVGKKANARVGSRRRVAA